MNWYLVLALCLPIIVNFGWFIVNGEFSIVILLIGSFVIAYLTFLIFWDREQEKQKQQDVTNS